MKKHHKSSVSDFFPPERKCDTQWGRIPHAEWCELEMERINRDGDTVHITTRPDNGWIALTR